MMSMQKNKQELNKWKEKSKGYIGASKQMHFRKKKRNLEKITEEKYRYTVERKLECSNSL